MKEAEKEVGSSEEAQEKQRLGRESEGLVARWLEEKGYTVLAKNQREAGGELDIVCRRGGEIVFVEVRSRSAQEEEEEAIESITKGKQRRIRRAAAEYLAGIPEDYKEVRFFVAIVTWEAGLPHIRVIEDAF